MIKKIVRKIVRFFFNARENETILDSIDRNKKNLLKRLTRRKYSSDDLKNALQEIGIQKGDILFLHSSIRSFFEFSDIDESIIIDILKEIIGKQGAILMPSYGSDIFKFDVKKTPSKAGSISNVFIQDNQVHRSLNSYFSVSCWSKDYDEFIDDHINSLNPFDEFSPFEKLLKNKGKILTLGIGKYPYKISFIHYIVYYLRKTHQYVDVFDKVIETEVTDYNDKIHKKNLLIRNGKFQNNNRNIKKLMKDVTHNSTKIGFLDIYMCSSVDLLNEAIDKSNKGISFYRK